MTIKDKGLALLQNLFSEAFASQQDVHAIRHAVVLAYRLLAQVQVSILQLARTATEDDSVAREDLLSTIERRTNEMLTLFLSNHAISKEEIEALLHDETNTVH